MDQITHDVRTAQWAEIVRKCHERPENQTAKEWMDENGINEKQYYYWQRRLRTLAAESANQQLPINHQSSDVTFYELPITGEEVSKPATLSVPVHNPDALIRIGKMEIELRNGISDDLLTKILKVAAYAR
jgi:hypothetical protein